jgi:polyisoprenoid-binding protein YceI
VTRFRIDPARSTVRIEARSSLHPIRSESTGLEGYLDAELLPDGRIDVEATIAGRVELALERLSSGNPLYDREMRRRVDTRRYPTATGELSALKATGRDATYRVRGEVTFRGVTRSAEDDMAIEQTAPGTLRLEGRHIFDVREFGMEPPRILALRVYPEVEVSVELFAVKET